MASTFNPIGPLSSTDSKMDNHKEEENYRGQNFHFFTHYLTKLLLPPFGTKPLRAERNNNSSRVLFWMMDVRPKAGTQDVELWIPANPQHTDKIPSFKPWSGATSPPSGGHGDDQRPQAGCMLLLNQPAGLPSCLSLHQGLSFPGRFYDPSLLKDGGSSIAQHRSTLFNIAS